MRGWGIGFLLTQTQPIREQEDALRHARKRAQQRRRQAGRYALEIEQARARGRADTAERIEAERAEWLATLDATGND